MVPIGCVFLICHRLPYLYVIFVMFLFVCVHAVQYTAHGTKQLST